MNADLGTLHSVLPKNFECNSNMEFDNPQGFSGQDMKQKPLEVRRKKSKMEPKVDPSFKSKRYRDKLRAEVKELERLLPVDRPALNRKLDSQTVYRLVIAFLRIKTFFNELFRVVSPDHTTDKDPGAEVEEEDKKTLKNVEDYLSTINVSELLDGFLLLASADGTVLYVSENVMRYNGFHQFDLMHRCLYGVVHPEERCDLREILEHERKLPTVDLKMKSDEGKQNAKEEEGENIPVSFMCRMRSFNGNNADYIKVCCTGKIVSVAAMPKSSRTSERIVLLYCEPLLLPESDPSQGKNVFWSKHDLDLKFKELDKGVEQELGYVADELLQSSIYNLVHPEDLQICATVHKALIQTTSVQNMCFRFQKKNGEWLWLQSRGKLVSKNSKKFTIVFSHCPVRDEDCAFLQHEALLRRKYFMTELTHKPFSNYSDRNLLKNKSCPRDRRSDRKPITDVCAHEETTDDEAKLAFQSDLALSARVCQVEGHCQCPSTWHTLADRHSPIIPSSHITHKMTQKDKQRQFAEYKRNIKLEQKCFCNSNSSKFPHSLPEEDNSRYNYHAFSSQDEITATDPNRPQRFHLYRENYHLPPVFTYGSNQCGFNIGHQSDSDSQNYASIQMRYYNYGQECENHGINASQYPALENHGFNSTQFPYNCSIPSVTSSQFQSLKGRQCTGVESEKNRKMISNSKLQDEKAMQQIKEVNCNGMWINRGLPADRLTQQLKYGYPVLSDCHGLQFCDQLFPSIHQSLSVPFQSHANIRMSMLCRNNQFVNADELSENQFADRVQSFIHGLNKHPSALITHNEPVLDAADLYKQYQRQGHSCAIKNKCSNNGNKVIKYDIEASIHMKIVESESTSAEFGGEVNLPASGNFLECLNEN